MLDHEAHRLQGAAEDLASDDEVVQEAMYLRLSASQAGPATAHLDEAVVRCHGVGSMVLAGRGAHPAAVPLPALAAGPQALDRFTSTTTRAHSFYGAIGWSKVFQNMVSTVFATESM